MLTYHFYTLSKPVNPMFCASWIMEADVTPPRLCADKRIIQNYNLHREKFIHTPLFHIF